jgi:hypothetical protein
MLEVWYDRNVCEHRKDEEDVSGVKERLIKKNGMGSGRDSNFKIFINIKNYIYVGYNDQHLPMFIRWSSN